MEQAHGRHEAAESGDHADDLVVHGSKRRILGFTLLAAALTTLGVVAWVLGPTDLSLHPFLTRVALLIAVPFLAILTVVGFLQLFSSAPKVVVSHEGIWVNWSLMSSTQSRRDLTAVACSWG